MKQGIIIFLAMCQVAIGAQGLTFGFPAIPDDLRVPEQRAAWLFEHYWDCTDFSCPDAEDEVLEQAFVDYLTLIPIVESDSITSVGFARLLERADVSTSAEGGVSAVSQVADLAQKYLYTPESDFDNESVYILFLKEFTARYPDDVRAGYQLEVAQQNRPGSVMPDFPLVVDGRCSTLYEQMAEDSPTLLVVHDSTCEDCEAFLALLECSADVAKDVAARRLRVLAVNIGDPKDYLASAIMTHATPADGFDLEELINIRIFPTLYLLAPDHTVLEKEIKPNLKVGG